MVSVERSRWARFVAQIFKQRCFDVATNFRDAASVEMLNALRMQRLNQPE
jgi:hypothetical protein